MSGERELFDRAARDMRSEFRARMQELLASPDEAVTAEDAERAVVVEVRERPTPIASRRRPMVWLASAAAVILVLVGVLAVTGGPEQIDVQSPNLPIATLPPPPGCEGAPLGTALTSASPIEVFALDDGSFCLERRGTDGVVIAASAVVPTLDPVVVESGPVEGVDAWYYVFAIPERLPVDVVLDERRQLARSFLHPAARRLLIVESDVAPLAPVVARSWRVAADPGGPFASLSAQGPLPTSASAPADGTMPPPTASGVVVVTASP